MKKIFLAVNDSMLVDIDDLQWIAIMTMRIYNLKYKAPWASDISPICGPIVVIFFSSQVGFYQPKRKKWYHRKPDPIEYRRHWISKNFKTRKDAREWLSNLLLHHDVDIREAK